MADLATSDAVRRAQAALGVPQTGHWDPVTMGAILAYQGGHHGSYPMVPHGHPDPATLANLGYFDPVAELSPAWVDYVHGGARPSTFGRDLGSTLSQIPRWAWIGTGALLLAAGFWTWHRSRTRTA